MPENFTNGGIISEKYLEGLRKQSNDSPEFFIPLDEGKIITTSQSLEDMTSLAGEILATISLPQNEKLFELFPESWHVIVSNWNNKFKEIKARNI